MSVRNQEPVFHGESPVLAYLYKVTLIPTGEYYIGYRYRNQAHNRPPEQDLWIKYFTSSNTVKKLIDQYGKDNFKIEFLEKSKDSLQLWEREQLLIMENWNDPLLLNKKYSDPISKCEHFRRNTHITEEVRKKMSIAGKGRRKSEEHRRKIAESNRGKKRSDATRQKLSQSKIGKDPHNKGKSPPRVICPNCNLETSYANYRKWHLNGCQPTPRLILLQYFSDKAGLEIKKKTIMQDTGMSHKDITKGMAKLKKEGLVVRKRVKTESVYMFQH